MQMDWAFFRYTSTSRSTTFSQLENADCSGSMGTILVSFSKDGLISASVSRLIKQAMALAMAVINGTDRAGACCTSRLQPDTQIGDDRRDGYTLLTNR